MTTLAALVERFVGRRILVVGDVMLDEYLRGTVKRISPEAPVPVVEVRERFCTPGGAGNVAMNLRALGAEVVLAGVVGADELGRELCRLLDEAGIDCSAIVTSRGRPTTTKTRVVAGAPSGDVHHAPAVGVRDEGRGDEPRSAADHLRRRARRVARTLVTHRPDDLAQWNVLTDRGGRCPPPRRRACPTVAP